MRLTTQLFFVFSSIAFTQTIHDTVFNDIILISAKDVATNGYDFLIDIPIKSKKGVNYHIQ